MWKRLGLCGLLAAAYVPASAAANAHPLYLFGTVGRFSVLFMIDKNGSEISGWYFYLHAAKEIRVAGKREAGGAFALDEFDPTTGRKTARFTGSIVRGDWTGSWQRAAGGAALPFTLHENHDTLGALDGRFQCNTKETEKRFGVTFASSLDLTVKRGKVTGFTLNHSAVSKADSDEQDCSVGLENAPQRQSDVGILLHSKPGGDINQQCAIRIVGNGEFLYIQVGDASEANADCRGDGTAMLCSARGSWSDVLFDRKTHTCRTTE